MRSTKKHLALLLAALMCLTLLPLSALASEEAEAEDAAEDATEEYVEELAEDPIEVPADETHIDEHALDGTGVIDSGCFGIEGDNLTWTLTDDGTLTISGTGEMEYFIKGEPWQEYRDFITDLVYGPGVVDMGDFPRYLSNLKSVTLGDSIKDYYEYPFGNPLFGLKSLVDIKVSDGNPYSTSVDGVLFTKDMTALLVYPAGRSGAYNIPDGVTEIWWKAFIMAEKLTSVTIPDSVTSIDQSSFAGSGLEEIIIPDSVTMLGAYAFMDCGNLETVSIGKGCAFINFNDFCNCTNLKSITIPSSVESIAPRAFDGCGQLEDVYYSGSEEQWNKIMTTLFSELIIKRDDWENDQYQPISQTTEIDGVIYSNYDLSLNSELGAAKLHFAVNAAPAPELSLSADAKTAKITGDFTGLYARVALVLNNGGQSGLYVTQTAINPDGTIVIPQFQVPGITVTGVNISLVGTIEDISSSTPNTVAMVFRML